MNTCFTPHHAGPRARTRGLTTLIVAAVLLAGGVADAREGAGSAATRERLAFNADWRFVQGDPAGATNHALSYTNIQNWVKATGAEYLHAAGVERPAGNPGADVAYTQAGFDDSSWRRLNLPHDWGVEGAFKQELPGGTGRLPWWGVGWYRKHFSVPPGDSGRRLFLDVDGAMSYAAVWLNGQFVGGWPYGYASFQLELTPYVQYGGENVLAIRLDNPPDSSRWYPGGGIYRNVWLEKTGPVHVGHWGTYVTTTEVSPDAAQVNLDVTVVNQAEREAAVTVRTTVYALNGTGQKAGGAVAVADPASLRIAPGARASAGLKASVSHPKLWSVKSPNRYSAVTTIEQEGRVVDSYDTPFGIRAIKFDPDRGFLLNGERVKIQGVCDHHDLGPLGAALNLRALERQIEMLREMGCNAIRTSHNPPAPELLDLCDRIGLLVMDESFDCWRRSKTRNGYHRLFDDWHEKDWRALIRRDRNHPCVILWSIGNEVAEQGSLEGHQLAAELTRIAHEEDPTRPATAGCNDVKAGYNGFQLTVDVFGYNYKPEEYGKFHAQHPPLALYGSETASCVSSRGEYFFPVSTNKSEGRANYQVSSYDLYAPPWATSPDTEFRGQDEFPFVAGEFVWTGWDYLGEPTPFGRRNDPARSSYFGVIDLAGFKKDRFYLYQARWRPELPMAHVLPHWNWPDRAGQVTPVHVYTSGDEAELFLNGRSLGRKKIGPREYRLSWDEVAYQPGRLKVVAYRQGKRWATDTVETTGPAAQLALRADRARIRADGQDLSFITVTVADQHGRLVPQSKNRVRFEISGPGEIAAVDNGDPTRLESFQARDCAAFNGLCLVVVRATSGSGGAITLKALSEGLEGGSVRLTSRADGGRRQ